MIDWEVLYIKIITERLSSCGENHHIIPKHAGGVDSDGIVMLKRRDHTLAHYIRWRWKKEIGDKIAYTMMSGQSINPMLDIKSRVYVMKKIVEYYNNPIYIKKKKEEAVNRWKSDEYRTKVRESKQKWLSIENNKNKLVDRLNTEDAKKKRIKSLKEYYKTVENSIISDRAKKAGKTVRETYTKEDIKTFKSRSKQKNGMYGKGYLVSGKKSGKWNGISYIVESNGRFTEYDNQCQLQLAYGVSKITIEKYADTDIIIERGSLKGSKIFTKKD